MAQYIPKHALVTEIERLMYAANLEADIASTGDCFDENIAEAKYQLCKHILDVINTFEVKEVDLMIHTIIAECCDWLTVYTELNHEQIEDCRNLMLTVKDEQLKAKQE